MCLFRLIMVQTKRAVFEKLEKIVDIAYLSKKERPLQKRVAPIFFMD